MCVDDSPTSNEGRTGYRFGTDSSTHGGKAAASYTAETGTRGARFSLPFEYQLCHRYPLPYCLYPGHPITRVVHRRLHARLRRLPLLLLDENDGVRHGGLRLITPNRCRDLCQFILQIGLSFGKPGKVSVSIGVTRAAPFYVQVLRGNLMLG